MRGFLEPLYCPLAQLTGCDFTAWTRSDRLQFSYFLVMYCWQGFFEALRMEIADSGVTVVVVCPGKVDVPAASDRFGTTLDKV